MQIGKMPISTDFSSNQYFTGGEKIYPSRRKVMKKGRQEKDHRYVARSNRTGGKMLQKLINVRVLQPECLRYAFVNHVTVDDIKPQL